MRLKDLSLEDLIIGLFDQESRTSWDHTVSDYKVLEINEEEAWADCYLARTVKL